MMAIFGDFKSGISSYSSHSLQSTFWRVRGLQTKIQTLVTNREHPRVE